MYHLRPDLKHLPSLTPKFQLVDNCIIALLMPHVPPEENEAKGFEIDITHGVMSLHIILVSLYALASSSNIPSDIYIDIYIYIHRYI